MSEPTYLTRADVIVWLRTRGVVATDRQLKRWATYGLIPKPIRRAPSAGRLAMALINADHLPVILAVARRADRVLRSDTGTCKDCRWWGPINEDAPVLAGQEDWHPCILTEMDMGQPMHPTSRAVAADGEDYKAVLATAPDFGCVQWEAKEL